MVQIVNLCELVSNHDLVLLDTSMFPGHRRSDEGIYHANNTSELEQYCPDLEKTVGHCWWMNRGIVPCQNVYTIPNVVEELKSMRDYLRLRHSFCRKFGTSKEYTRFLKNKAKLRTYNSELEEENDANFIKIEHKSTRGLTLLHCFSMQIDRAIKRIKQYSLKGPSLPRLEEEVSDTDYQLVEAAFGNLTKNPGSKTAVFTRDSHLIKIIDHFLDQDPPLSAGEVGVYRFSPGNVWMPGTLPLREAVISESEHYMRLQRA